ncbi:hypothetical protein [Paenibacillus oryzisoli]|uniref:STAS/SEC14 domain-containing protein n=1 Tax=Paenibacillus oryzisoli TaxID=1850517 RepID=A0A198A1F4_9BACL|nr:hypothetical protein [Paenibacillus oryzisoli]OAS14848.1 hypothetical protein A8708_04935 [Paenibacillus oryzisoli]
MMHYYFSDKVHIFWDDEIESVVIRWSYLAHSEDFRDPLNKLVELTKMKKSKKALFDESHSLFIAKDTQWLVDEWLPGLLEAGIQYLAIVFPENTSTNIEVESVIEKKDANELFHREFENIHSAVSWLSSVPVGCASQSN